jgi:hypothetical protein
MEASGQTFEKAVHHCIPLLSTFLYDLHQKFVRPVNGHFLKYFDFCINFLIPSIFKRFDLYYGTMRRSGL